MEKDKFEHATNSFASLLACPICFECKCAKEWCCGRPSSGATVKTFSVSQESTTQGVLTHPDTSQTTLFGFFTPAIFVRQKNTHPVNEKNNCVNHVVDPVMIFRLARYVSQLQHVILCPFAVPPRCGVVPCHVNTERAGHCLEDQTDG